MVWQSEAFSGSKIALFCGPRLVTYLRDDFAHIPFPAHWDLPGGGRESDESPVECALRETEEEFGLSLTAERVSELRRYPAQSVHGLNTYFCLAHITEAEVASIRFGDEGQHWQMMAAAEFISHPKAVPHLRARVKDVLRLR